MKLDMSNAKAQMQKTALAQLLANEGLKVFWKAGISTAAFDTKSRKIHMPIWNSTIPELVDMLCIHETGHALHTKVDPEALIKRIKAKTGDADKTIHFVWNVIEDVRINELQKEKYPGSRHDFRVGYMERYERGDYGGNIDFINTLNVADRINVHFKVPHVVVKFTPEEEIVVKKIAKIRTEAEVEVLIYDVLDLLRNSMFPMSGADQDMTNDGDGEGMKIGVITNSSGEEDGESDSDEDFDLLIDARDESDEETESKDGKDGKDKESKGKDGKESKNSEKSESGKGKDSKEGKEGDKSDNSGDKSDGKDDKKSKSKNVDMDSDGKGGDGKADGKTDRKVKPRQPLPVISLKTLEAEMESLAKYISKGMGENPSEYDLLTYYKNNPYRMQPASSNEKYMEFLTKNRSLINSMAAEFEIKKNANSFRRTAESKTGVLDMNKIYSYKIAEDIFRRSSSVQEGKNHSFVFLLDTSGSMATYMSGTINQLLIFAAFAKQIQVPFAVYSFGLYELLNSDMDKNTFGRMASGMINQNDGCKANGGTPLNHSILKMGTVMHEFIKKHPTHIFNFVTLTDGGASDSAVGTSLTDPASGKMFSVSKQSFLKSSTDVCLAMVKYRLSVLYPDIKIQFMNFNIQPKDEIEGYNNLFSYNEKFVLKPDEMTKDASVKFTDKAAVQIFKEAEQRAKYMKFGKNFAGRVAQTA